MNRTKQLDFISQNNNWDVIVIGGGASGLGAALDATTRGFKTLLLESNDFAKGTSSKSTKLVHGGVRYLAQGYVDLVKEALKERGLLAQNAAHLVKTQRFIIPNYTLLDGIKYKLGLTFYDILAKKLSLGKTEFIGKKKTEELLPNIKTKGLRSGTIYTDGQFDDSRLAINLAQSIVENSGYLLNYAPVTNLLKDNNGIVNGVEFKDLLSSNKYEVKAKVVINATGVFTNDIINMDDPKHGKFVIPSQGIHFVLDKSFLKGDDAIMIPKTSDGRVLFVVPWHNRCVVGTTDTVVDEASFEPKALEKEIEFVLSTAALYLQKKPTKEDVLSIFAGLRPLAAPKGEGKSSKEVSRSHKVIVHESKFVTITGGKWTTYRKMAEDVIDKAIEVGELDKIPCKTEHLPIHGNIPKEQVDRTSHLYIYGSDIENIKNLQKENPKYSEKIHPNFEYTFAEVAWAIKKEMAIKLEDVLSRRVRILFIDARAAIDCCESVAKFMAEEMNKDKEWVDNEIANFKEIAKGYLLVEYK